MKHKTQINHSYRFTQKELRKLLGFKGEIKNILLWEGLSPDEEERGITTDKTIWEVCTEEKRDTDD